MKSYFVYSERLDNIHNDGYDEIVYLNNYIKRVHADRLGNDSSYVLDEPLQNNDQYKAATKRIDAAYKIIIEIISKELDRKHGTEYGVDGWSILLFAFLDVYLGSLLYSYIKVRDLLDKRTTTVYSKLLHHYVPIDLDDMYDEPWFYEQLTEYVLLWYTDKEFPRRLQTSPMRINEFSCYNQSNDMAIMSIIKKTVKERILNLNICHPRVVFTGGYIYGGADLLAGLLTLGKVRRQEFPSIDKEAFQMAIGERIEIKREEYGDDYINIAVDLLPYVMPVIYVEGFSRYISAYKDMGLAIPKVMLTTRVVYYSIPMALYLIETRNANGKIYILQHGGGYGTDMYPWGVCEYKLADKYYTWGSAVNKAVEGAGGKAETFQVTKTIGRHYNGGEYKKILFAGYNTSSFIHDSSGITVWRNEQLIKAEDMFFERINMEIKKRIRYRAYREEHTLMRKTDLGEKFPDILFDEEKDFYRSLENTGLFITCFLSTTYLEAINLNVPTVLISCEEINIYDDRFLPVVKELKENNILFSNPQEAAQFVNSIGNSILLWWNDKKRQRTINRFRSLYCRRLRFSFLQSVKWLVTMK